MLLLACLAGVAYVALSLFDNAARADDVVPGPLSRTPVGGVTQSARSPEARKTVARVAEVGKTPSPVKRGPDVRKAHGTVARAPVVRKAHKTATRGPVVRKTFAPGSAAGKAEPRRIVARTSGKTATRGSATQPVKVLHRAAGATSTVRPKALPRVRQTVRSVAGEPNRAAATIVERAASATGAVVRKALDPHAVLSPAHVGRSPRLGSPPARTVLGLRRPVTLDPPVAGARPALPRSPAVAATPEFGVPAVPQRPGLSVPTASPRHTPALRQRVVPATAGTFAQPSVAEAPSARGARSGQRPVAPAPHSPGRPDDQAGAGHLRDAGGGAAPPTGTVPSSWRPQIAAAEADLPADVVAYGRTVRYSGPPS
ncbi:hypothetical protein [Paractinoplanes abujensis]|uniref:Secreted protein n=1 Tax=Paractinoplanes abujensis TaxID=882441 RepID=A0A7W7G088_9ACTN|nr:hypothetical protein [Actinoplanes abujensis]MBB4692858.1 hypothetical protein [Actinoplanes abujensis]